MKITILNPEPFSSIFETQENQDNPMLKTFVDDDAGYLKWVKRHPIGYVLNTTRPPLPNFLILHLASCPAVSGRAGLGNYWTAESVKVCSIQKSALDSWAQQEAGGKLSNCHICNP